MEVLANVLLGRSSGTLAVNPVLRVPRLAAGAVTAALFVHVYFFFSGKLFLNQKSHQLVSLVGGVVDGRIKPTLAANGAE